MEAVKTQVPLEQVIYELLDAHQDTLRLTAQQRTSREWEIHCAYLRDLQRVALEAVGRAGVGDVAGEPGGRAPQL